MNPKQLPHTQKKKLQMFFRVTPLESRGRHWHKNWNLCQIKAEAILTTIFLCSLEKKQATMTSQKRMERFMFLLMVFFHNSSKTKYSHRCGLWVDWFENVKQRLFFGTEITSDLVNSDRKVPRSPIQKYDSQIQVHLDYTFSSVYHNYSVPNETNLCSNFYLLDLNAFLQDFW